MMSSLAKKIEMEDAKFGSDHSAVVLFVAATMNGWKPTILMEELGQPYEYVFVDLSKDEQKSKEYLEINPNGRIPAVYDRETGVTLAESGAVLLYLAEKYGPGPMLPDRKADPKGYWEVAQWVFWQVSGLGPALGQAMFFNRIAAPKGNVDEFAIGRFGAESKRCLEVLETQLAKSGGPFLLGEAVTLADVSCYAYAKSHFWAKVDVCDLPLLQQWLKTLDARQGFATGLTIPHERREFFGEGDVASAEAANASSFKVYNEKN